MSISAVIITKNEEDNIRRCLASVKWCDEIVVLDSGSTDNTVAICKAFTDKVFVTDWPGFGKQFNRAIDSATSNWVLSIDADEWLDPKLIAEIQAVLRNPKYDGYSVLRRSNFCGRFIKYGTWRSDRVNRLFKNGKGRCTEDIIHPCVKIQGSLGKLKHLLWHNAMKDLDTALNKMNQYTSLSAEMKHKRGKKGSLGKALGHGFWAFLRSYILKLGFLDGPEGFILAVNIAEISYYRYLKLKYLASNMEKSECMRHKME